jgi:hypothetical protein
VAAFESATGLDPWGRLLANVKDKLVGDLQDDLRAAVLPGSPYRDEGTQQTVSFQKGTIWDPAFAAWAGAQDGDEAEGSKERADLRIEVMGPENEPLHRYLLRRCSVQRVVSRTRASGPPRVTRLDVGYAGWDWDAPEGPALAGTPAAAPAGSMPLGRPCWRGVAAGVAVGALVVAAALAPRLGSEPTPATEVGSQRPVSAPSLEPEPVGSPPKEVVLVPKVVPPPRVKRTVEPTLSPAGGSPSVTPPTAPSPLTTVSGQPPVAADDAYATYYGTTLNVRPPGVLANDQDPDGDPLTASLVGQPKYGTVSLNLDGSFSYTPGETFYGTDSFTYQALGGGAASNVATVQITVYAS